MNGIIEIEKEVENCSGKTKSKIEIDICHFDFDFIDFKNRHRKNESKNFKST